MCCAGARAKNGRKRGVTKTLLPAAQCAAQIKELPPRFCCDENLSFRHTGRFGRPWIQWFERRVTTNYQQVRQPGRRRGTGCSLPVLAAQKTSVGGTQA